MINNKKCSTKVSTVELYMWGNAMLVGARKQGRAEKDCEELSSILDELWDKLKEEEWQAIQGLYERFKVSDEKY